MRGSPQRADLSSEWARAQLKPEIALFVRIRVLNRTRSGAPSGSGSEWYPKVASEGGSEL